MKPLPLLLGTVLLGLTLSTQAAGVADLHKNLPCTTCHVEKNIPPTRAQCSSCHEDKALVTATADVKPVNPHVSPHYDLDCTNCHKGHSAGTDFCSQCHKFDFRMP